MPCEYPLEYGIPVSIQKAIHEQREEIRLQWNKILNERKNLEVWLCQALHHLPVDLIKDIKIPGTIGQESALAWYLNHCAEDLQKDEETRNKAEQELKRIRDYKITQRRQKQSTGKLSS